VITLPPLRAREQDVIYLAEHFAVQICMELGWPVFSGFSSAVRQQLLAHSWPGNIRELKNTIERSVYRHGQPGLQVDQLFLDPFASPWRPIMATPSLPAKAEPPLDLKQYLEQEEARLVKAALAQTGYHQGQAAEQLRLSYHQLRGLLRKHPTLH